MCTGIKVVSVDDKRVVTMVTTLPVSRILVDMRKSRRDTSTTQDDRNCSSTHNIFCSSIQQDHGRC